MFLPTALYPETAVIVMLIPLLLAVQVIKGAGIKEADANFFVLNFDGIYSLSVSPILI